MELALMLEGQDGLNWERWMRLGKAAEDLGFAGLYRSDHYTNANPPEKDSLELWVSLTWLAANTKQIEFGPLVSPFSFRHPSLTARMASAVDDLSGGRLQLGLGAGWQLREHDMFGLDLLELPERMQRFQEGLEVVSQLMKSDAPFSYAGNFYELKDAIMLPRPLRRGGPPIVVGGNGARRTLQLAAKYANEWNAVSQTSADFRARCLRLDKYLVEEGREPSAVKRSMMTNLMFGRDKAELDAQLQGRDPQKLRDNGRLVGEANQIVEQLGVLAEAGCQRVMLQWLDMDETERLEKFAASVLSQIKH
jgi:F420-dependent oxidoreductase-like protein